MKRIIGMFLTVTAFFVFGAGHILYGQNTGIPTNNNSEERRSDKWVDQSLAGLRKMESDARQDAIIKPQPYKLRPETIIALEKYLLLEDLSKIKPAQKYFVQFADFLKDKNTGLARLHPYMKCDQGLTVSIQEIERCADTLQIRGGGSFYSFRNRTTINESGNWSDIQLTDGKFVVGSKTQFGLIRELGEVVSLEELSLKSKEFEFLLKYKPKSYFQEVKLEKERLDKGLIDRFSSSAELKLNSTYILRSIAYQLQFVKVLDNRADIIVAFKVIAQEDDGSIILLWKQLKSNTPKKLKGEITN